MGRLAQPLGERGSLRWIQKVVNERPSVLDDPILDRLPAASRLEWRSPLSADDYAEYRDGDFLQRVGLERLSDELRAFWPERGPQWDALARSDTGDVILVEAKAHIGELLSPGTKAGKASRARIEAALGQVADALQARPLAPWSAAFYQLANRIAHLHFLRERHGVPAWLVLVNFVGDADVGGPDGAAEWHAAYEVVQHVMGLPKRHRLAPYIVEILPDVRGL